MQVKGTEWKFGLIFKNKERKKRKKKKKRCVTQQRVNLTKSFAKQTDTFTVLNFPT